MDSNRRPLASEVTALPTEPQPYPLCQTFTTAILDEKTSCKCILSCYGTKPKLRS